MHDSKRMSGQFIELLFEGKKQSYFKNYFNSYSFFIFFAIVIYVLINSIYENGTICVVNRLLLSFFLGIVIIKGVSVKLDLVSIMFLVFGVYMLFSLFLTSVERGYSLDTVFKEILYLIIPIGLFYVAHKDTWFDEKFYRVFIVVMLIVVVIGIPIYLKNFNFYFFNREIKILRSKNIGAGFGSFIGVIGFGYLSQLSFVICLFDKICMKKLSLVLMFVFGTSTVLSLQRAPLVGIFIGVIMFFLNKNGIKKTLKYIIFSISFLLIVYYSLIDKLNVLTGLNMNRFIENTFNSMNTGLEERSNQFVIYLQSMPEYLFGIGVGTFSPNNPDRIQLLTDAGFYRVLNEMGGIGFCLFIAPYIFLLYKSALKKNCFAIYFIVFSIASFYVNRTIWSIPSVFIFYIILGLESKKSEN